MTYLAFSKAQVYFSGAALEDKGLATCQGWISKSDLARFEDEQGWVSWYCCVFVDFLVHFAVFFCQFLSFCFEAPSIWCKTSLGTKLIRTGKQGKGGGISTHYTRRGEDGETFFWHFSAENDRSTSPKGHLGPWIVLEIQGQSLGQSTQLHQRGGARRPGWLW